MARSARDAKLDSRTARQKLKQRREPYWKTLYEGCAIGYRKGAKGGTWIAKHYNAETGRRYKPLGSSDDLADANARSVLSFTQAQEKARSWFTNLAKIDAGDLTEGPYSVSDAIEDYLKTYEREGGNSGDRMKYVVEAHIKPVLGNIELAKLRRTRIETWLHDLAERPNRLRTKPGESQRYSELDESEEGKRKRRATANRCLTILKAALNKALQKGKISGPEAWKTVKPFRNVDAAVIRYLSEAEVKRLVNASDLEFRPLIQAAVLTGCRYGELVTLKAKDYNSDGKSISIVTSKKGKPRHVYLTDEANRFFETATINKSGLDLLFTKENGETWGRSHQQRRLAAACKKAKISPSIRFHDLRHTHGSTLAMKGVPMGVIAAQLGHADTRLTEKHYAHLAPSYVSDTVRTNFPDLGIVPDSNVKRLGSGKRNASR